MKARIFIDFWNFQLTLNNVASSNYRVDWKKLAPWLIHQTSEILGTPLSYEGANIYLSYDPGGAKDIKLRDFAVNVLDRLPGIQVTLKERKARNAPTCPTCHQLIKFCPHCNSPMNRLIEKGVDTAMVTDLLKLAWENAWEIAIVISSDRDFIPAIELLDAKGYRVINAHFPPNGMHLARACWASIDLRSGLPNLRWNPSEK
ncbi:MAG: NYN domain-containing protein [Anaerolineales bacterium]